MLYTPTEDMTAKISSRIEQAIMGCPELYAGLDVRTKSKEKMTLFSVPLYFGWGGSVTQTASVPAELVLFDELDRLKANAEGNPWQQTKARKATFAQGKHVGASSPTWGVVLEYKHPDTGLIHWEYQKEKEKLPSLTWQLWQEGSRGEFMLPCPHCGAYFAPKSKLLLASLPEDCSPEYALEHAGLMCPHCATIVEQKHQLAMISKGKMIFPG